VTYNYSCREVPTKRDGENVMKFKTKREDWDEYNLFEFLNIDKLKIKGRETDYLWEMCKYESENTSDFNEALANISKEILYIANRYV